jgi:LuxR family maltose regulon positive regulatory protein
MGLYKSLSKNRHKDIHVKSNTLLSTRESEIMNLISLGKTNEEMGKTLFISVGTIKWHINHIFSKLEVRNRVEAIEKAKNLGEI